jgi:hypothetical protein
MIFSRRHVLVALSAAALLHTQTSSAFQAPTSRTQHGNGALSIRSSPSLLINYQTVNGDNSSNNNSNNTHDKSNSSRTSRRRRIAGRIVTKAKQSLALLTPILLAGTTVMGVPQLAQASAPVMALPKAEARDPAVEAIQEHQRQMQQKAQDDLRRYTLKCRQIEAKEGEAARASFEQEFKEGQIREVQEKKDGLVELKRNLLDQGIDPSVDLEGRRQILLWEKGVDLGEVSGTQFNLEKEFEAKNVKKSWSFKKQQNREMIKAMVQDMKNRGVDPVAYFESHQDKTANILDLNPAQAAALAAKYQANLEEYGQISPPKEGETSAKEMMADSVDTKVSAKRVQSEAKAKAAEEKAALKVKAKEEKAKTKEAAKAAKEAAKKEKVDAKAAAAAAAAGAAAATAAAAAAAATAGAAEVAGSAVSAVGEAVEQGASTEVIVAPEASASDEIGGEDIEAPEESDSSSTAAVSEKKVVSIPILPVSAFVVAAGGSGVAFKMYRQKVAAAEEDRQKQFRLLMGEGNGTPKPPSSAPALEEIDADMDDFPFDDEVTTRKEPEKGVSSSVVSSAPEPVEAPPKKRKLGIRSVFGKKKNSRDTDIYQLVNAGAKAPGFATTLAKLLTFGAPGRFPVIMTFPGKMPLIEFNLEEACTVLTAAQDDVGLTKEEAAEIFANVVNCMLIEIVDLASTSLKEKDDKLTVDAISIVVDYMNHAASLYNSIAEGVVITPVTYGGGLSKSKLEQMYSAYAASGMTNMGGLDGDFENRVALLQDVFEINEKKAEGLMMKAMQKNMMDMMKSGEGMEGMEEMMKGMGGTEGGMPGMEGMPGMSGMPGKDGEEPSPEQLKEMLLALKQMKDSGSIPDSELEEVKKQFKEAFGSGIDDVMKEADGSSEDLASNDKELLDLMKSILDD